MGSTLSKSFFEKMASSELLTAYILFNGWKSGVKALFSLARLALHAPVDFR